MQCGLSVRKLTLVSELSVRCVNVLNCYKRILGVAFVSTTNAAVLNTVLVILVILV